MVYIEGSLLVGWLIILIGMQVPTAPYQGHSSMFEAILEECSMKDIDAEPIDHHHEDSIQLVPPQPKQNSWFWLHEAPFDPTDDQMHTQDDLSLEFKRVKSLREEQETKIAMFLRQDKCKNRPATEHAKNESPVGKYSQSLSPRKTKKIDKPKQLKLLQQEC